MTTDTTTLLYQIRRGDRRVLESFVRRKQGLVDRIASRFQGLADHEDMISAGKLGLMRAVARYDPKGGMPFNVFCRRSIEKAIRREIDRTELIRTPSDAEVPVGVFSLDDTVVDEEGKTTTFHELIPDTKLLLPDERAAKMEVLAEVVELPPRERAALILTYGLDRRGELTIEAAAAEMDCSPAAVKRLRKRGLKMLRDRIETEEV
ncbi:MAG: sigma-70 family RNA polymerase sigma factor [Chitinivibrionales bacterium]|nr:sigma-70 family RNA polymerase sigma factor [Chitinivibrionales bacterium]MBD3358033.1 sigma-70 family RNA polymerase sigma factor [Chitinivibrionales bacterium]